MRSATSFAALLAPTVMLATPAAAAQTAPASRFAFSVPPQGLEEALLAVARQSGREIIFSSDLASGRRSPRLIGRLTVDEALRRLLAGTGLTIREDGGTLVVVRDVDPAISADIVVTGSRIRGAERYSPVAVLGRPLLQDQGQTDLGEAMRTLPQNFGGGQNPYIGLGAENFGSDNLNSGSSINLRGLGPDATLTLLNGRRVAYDGVSEGVDVSTIPLAAIDRIEVVADGASAIYGSDAVAGVVNIVLRRDYSGLETSARLGASTDGGDVQQQIDGVAGSIWSSGGVVGTLSYDHNSAITANKRSFSQGLDRTTYILPSAHHLGATLSSHQQIGSGVETDIDFLYSRRSTFSTFPNSTTNSYVDNGIDRQPKATSIAVSPVVKVDLGRDWVATISATYGRDDTAYRTRYFAAGAVVADYRGAYLNQSAGGEVSAEGVVARLPGGDARLALGAGYRWVGLKSDQSDGSTDIVAIDHGRRSVYGFGELNAPIVGAGNRRAGIDRLSVNVAGRFEHYPQIGDVFTPKVGLLYAPARMLELRGTWGKSFKAPTLFQLYQAPGALLYPASLFGGVGYPANATAIFAYGGNPDLKPQRATSWSAGTTIFPFADRRLTFEATYFRTSYTDRIVAPITSALTALADPTVADLVALRPSLAAINGLLAAVPDGLVNYSGLTYDPAGVAAIIDNRNHNVASQHIDGVDLAAAWRIAVAARSSVTLNASATYLRSRQQLSAGQPSRVLAGTIFSPPHLRARGGVSYAGGPVTVSLFATVAGGVDDSRFSPTQRVRGQTTVDLSGGYAIPAATGMLHGLSVRVSVLNLLDRLPERIRTEYAFYTPFDATNYSPVGRLVSATVTKKW